MQLTANAQKDLTDEYTLNIEPARLLSVKAKELEIQLFDSVNQAYGLSEEQIDLMWKTAPPRTPLTNA